MEIKILMVCLGNICRSPMAEGILRKLAESMNLPVLIDSAGTSHWHAGEPPDSRAVLKSKEHGVDISGLRARQFKTTDFQRFDHIFVMDRNNYADVVSLSDHEHDREKVGLLLDKTYPGMMKDVPDPYFGGESGFEEVYQMIHKACEKITSEISSRVNPKL